MSELNETHFTSTNPRLEQQLHSAMIKILKLSAIPATSHKDFMALEFVTVKQHDAIGRSNLSFATQLVVAKGWYPHWPLQLLKISMDWLAPPGVWIFISLFSFISFISPKYLLLCFIIYLPYHDIYNSRMAHEWELARRINETLLLGFGLCWRTYDVHCLHLKLIRNDVCFKPAVKSAFLNRRSAIQSEVERLISNWSDLVTF